LQEVIKVYLSDLIAVINAEENGDFF
jgi:hypothetical protein